jgi:hypothetical protein
VKTSNEIKSGYENIEYYSNEIQKLIEGQLNLDLNIGKELGFNDNSQSVRFEALASIHTACDAIKLYIANIKTNLVYCEAQDKILHSQNEENN